MMALTWSGEALTAMMKVKYQILFRGSLWGAAVYENMTHETAAQQNPFSHRDETRIRMRRALRDPHRRNTLITRRKHLLCHEKSLTWSVSIGRFGSETGSRGSFPGHCHPSSFFSPCFDLLDSRVQAFCSQMDLIHGISHWYLTSDRKMAAGVDSCRHHPAPKHRIHLSINGHWPPVWKRDGLKYVINEMARSTPLGLKSARFARGTINTVCYIHR